MFASISHLHKVFILLSPTVRQKATIIDDFDDKRSCLSAMVSEFAMFRDITLLMSSWVSGMLELNLLLTYERSVVPRLSDAVEIRSFETPGSEYCSPIS